MCRCQSSVLIAPRFLLCLGLLTVLGCGGNPASGAPDGGADATPAPVDGGHSDGGPDTSCTWPSEPRLAVVSDGSPSEVHHVGDRLFSRWLAASGVHVVRTDLPYLSSATIWEGDAMHILLGVSPDTVYVGHSTDEPTWLDVLALSHEGTPLRTVSLAGLTVRRGGFRVANRLYAISGTTLLQESDGAWRPLDVGGVSSFISFPNSPTIIVLDQSGQRFCVLDESREVLDPCRDVPQQLSTSSWVYGLWRVGYNDGTWVIVAYIQPGGQALAVSDGEGWQVLASTNNEWSVNDLVDDGLGGWLWLRQESVDMNHYLTRAVHWGPTAGAAEVWSIAGQAFGTVVTDCGFAFSLKNKGLFVSHAP